jgi:hypothetical protein
MRELPAINRLIWQGRGVQPEAAISSRDFLREVKAPPARSNPGKVNVTSGAPRSRYCLSHFRLLSATSKPTGQKLAEGRFFACVRCVCMNRSSAMGAGGNKPRTKITTGFRSAAAAAICARKPSPSHRRSLRDSHYSLIARSQALRRYFLGRLHMGGRRARSEKIQIALLIHPLCGDGFELWIPRGRCFRSCAA